MSVVILRARPLFSQAATRASAWFRHPPARRAGPGSRGLGWILGCLAALGFGVGARAAAGGAGTPSGVAVPEVSGERYDWTRTLQPERPYVHPYHQTLVMKLFLAWKRDNDRRGPSRVVDGSSVYLTFEEALEVIRRLDRLTLGIPKIVYLVGWQHDGHDSKYPDWSVVNPRLKRAQDATAADSLRWLMDEGFKHHTTVSLHVNLFDAYRDSPLWDTYLRHDILARHTDGRLVLGEVGDLPGAAPATNTQVHYLSYAREWETGFTRKRIDGLLALLPIQRAGTIHVDAFHSLRPIPHAYPQERYPDQPKSDTRISPFLDYSLEREVAAQRRVLRYLRDLGVDVTSEGSTFLRPDAFTGLQPMAWDYQPPAPGIPPSLYCGTPMRAEPEILRDPVNLTGLVPQFCERVVPWFYENNATAPKGAQAVKDGDARCVPALWRERTLVAFSRSAVTRRWTLPPGWDGVARVEVAELTVDGPRRLRTLPVEEGAIRLELAAGQGVVVTAEAGGVAGKEGGAGPEVGKFQAPLHPGFAVRPLPGHRDFVFSLYGVPAEAETLRQVAEVMRDQTLGNGFDPGPAPHPGARAVFEQLAEIGWPVICYPGCADMQIQGGRCVLGPEHASVLEPLDRAGVFSAVQLGEWGYYFHNLSHNEPWFRDVYGKDVEAFRHLLKPAGLAGYDRRPASRQECHDRLREYFTSRSRDLLGRVISVTGHSHYEAYAGDWGARCLGLELGENIAFTQSKLAFARGAARRWDLPWSVQVSPWFHGACTTRGPLRGRGGEARGLDAGHSLSLYERMWLHGWFAGASMVTPENSMAIFFEQDSAPWTLTEHGRRAAEVFRFMRAHDRGTPFTPVAVVLDRLAGYNGYMDKPWGILEPTPGDRQLRDLFDHQLFPGADHIHVRPDPDNPEAAYLRPTPFGEMFDVQLSDAPAERLLGYEVLLLAGDLEFTEARVETLERVLAAGRTVLLSVAHRAALGERFARLARHPGLEVLEPWVHPGTGRPAAIPDRRLEQLRRDLLPVEIAGDPVQFQVNRTPRGWVVELIHNGGVRKKPDQPAVVDPTAVARVRLRPRVPCLSAREWRAERSFPDLRELEVEIGPGGTAYVELRCP